MHNVLIVGGMGYIGSSVYGYLSSAGYQVRSVDLELFKDTSIPGNVKSDYKTLSAEFIGAFDAIIFLAGHSSVKACELDLVGSLKNNCINFFRFVEKLNPKQKFIYASSGSVYGLSGSHKSKETDPLPVSIKDYDRQKRIIDYYMEESGRRFYGLRFGTVCGYSLNPRNELMINSMTKSALLDKKVVVSNPDHFRAVLGIQDLCRAITHLLTGEISPGYYNLASFNMTIGDIGQAVARLFNVKLEISSGDNNYSFCLDVTKFEHCAGMEFLDTPETIAKQAARNDFTVTRQ